MEYGDDLDGWLELQFLGLNILKNQKCDVYLLNQVSSVCCSTNRSQDVRFESGCGWDVESKNYEGLIPAEPFYTFREA